MSVWPLAICRSLAGLEEGAGMLTPEPFDELLEGVGGGRRQSNPTLLIPFALADEDTALFTVEVIELDGDALPVAAVLVGGRGIPLAEFGEEGVDVLSAILLGAVREVQPHGDRHAVAELLA